MEIAREPRRGAHNFVAFFILLTSIYVLANLPTVCATATTPVFNSKLQVNGPLGTSKCLVKFDYDFIRLAVNLHHSPHLPVNKKN